MSVRDFIQRRAATWCTVAAVGMGMRLWAQAPAAAAPSGWETAAQVTQGLDTNVLLSTSHPQASATTLYALTLGRTWASPRSSFTVSFMPRGEMFSGHQNLDYLAESYQQAWSYAWRNTTLTWSASADHMPERAQGGMLSAGAGAVGAAGASSPMSLAMVVSNGSTSFGLSHQYSLRSSWSASATAGLQIFSQDLTLLDILQPGSPLSFQSSSRTRSLGGGFGWTHKLTAQRSFTLSANTSQMWYSNPARALLYTSLQASLTQNIGSSLTLTFGGGPAWNRTLGSTAAALPGLASTTYAANAGLNWQHGHSQYGLSWNRSDQSSYVPGGVTTQSLGLQYEVRWGQSWSAGASFGASQFAGLAGRSQNSTYVSGQLGRRLAAGLSLSAAFSYSTQSLPAAAGGFAPLNRANVSLGLSYQPGGAR